MFGFLVIDKPRGISSRTALDWVAKRIRPIKAGHAGTLDPLATGVLVLCLGSATRLVSLVQQMPKSYRARFRLGFESETEDIGSPLIPVGGATQIGETDLRTALSPFRGYSLQQPPQYSALRQQGQRAYHLARTGQQVDLQPRTIRIDRLELIEFQNDEFELDIQCGSGTYVRSLGRDIGRSLGSGAVMTELRRTAVGPFGLDRAMDIQRWNQSQDFNLIHASLIEPRAALLAGLKIGEIELDEQDVADLYHGRPLKRLQQRIEKEHSLLMGLDAQGRLMAILKVAENGEVTVESCFVRNPS